MHSVQIRVPKTGKNPNLFEKELIILSCMFVFVGVRGVPGEPGTSGGGGVGKFRIKLEMTSLFKMTLFSCNIANSFPNVGQHLYQVEMRWTLGISTDTLSNKLTLANQQKSHLDQ